MAAMAAGAQEYAESTLTETDLLKRELAQREAELAQRDAELAEIERRNIDKAIWSPGRFTKLGFNFASTGDGFKAVDKSQYSFTMSKGASYMFPSRPVAGMLKFGFDMTWFDFTFTKYKTPLTAWARDGHRKSNTTMATVTMMRKKTLTSTWAACRSRWVPWVLVRA